jgi:hypothetical protein
MRADERVNKFSLTFSCTRSLLCCDDLFRHWLDRFCQVAPNTERTMSAKKETFYVTKSNRGWTVKTDTGRGHLGPYSDREQAVLMALTFARDNRPSEVKIQNPFGGWLIERTFEEQIAPRSTT